MRERRAQGGEGGGFGGAGFGGGGSRRSLPTGESEGPVSRTLYILDNTSVPNAPVLRAVTVKTGIADNYNTEILEGLKDGDQVVTGIIQPLNATAAQPTGSSPFGGPFGGGRGPR